jgi:hypothetical protein
MRQSCQTWPAKFGQILLRPVQAKFKNVSDRRKSVTTGRTNERTDSRSPIYPNLFLADVYGLSLLNEPWRTVPLLLPLFGSVPNMSGVKSYRCSFRDIQGSKRPNTINFLFQIYLAKSDQILLVMSDRTDAFRELCERRGIKITEVQ